MRTWDDAVEATPSLYYSMGDVKTLSAADIVVCLSLSDAGKKRQKSINRGD